MRFFNWLLIMCTEIQSLKKTPVKCKVSLKKNLTLE